jgi:hypothetical protein
VKREKRIYVLVANTVYNNGRKIRQPKGRQIAQACHVTGLMRIAERIRSTKPVTTIILRVDDSYLLRAYRTLLYGAGVQSYSFYDTNAKAYGRGQEVLTAVCTVPVSPARAKRVLAGVPLWT